MEAEWAEQCEEEERLEGLGFEKAGRREGEVVMSIAPGELPNELGQMWHGLQNSQGHDFLGEAGAGLP